MKDLQEVIKDLHDSVEYDFEGDLTYRVHVKTAEKLIRDAYKLGIKERNHSMIQHADVILDYTWHNMSAGEFNPEDINSNSIVISLSEDQHYYISDVVSDLWKEILNDTLPEDSALQLHVYRTIFSVKLGQYKTWTDCDWEYDVDWEIGLISHQDTGMSHEEWEKFIYVQPTKEGNMVQLV